MKEIPEDDRRKIEKMYYRMRRHQCRYCPVRFNDKMKLMMHEATHTGRSVSGVGREAAGGYTPPNSSPQPHKYNAEDFEEADGQFKCPECPTMWLSIPEAQNHVRKMHTARMHQCKLCPLSYNDKRGLYQHMSRKHPRPSRPPEETDNPFVMSNLGRGRAPMSPADGGSRMAEAPPTPNMKPIQMADGTIKCPLCPKIYNSLGGFYIHKKNHHSQRSPGQAGDVKKKFWCEICGKFYSSYTSLYIHRKNLHPTESPRPGITQSPLMSGYKPIAPRPPPPSATIVNVGGGGINLHQCLKCDAKFSSLKMLALHIEDVHQGAAAAGEESGGGRLVDCPYCNSAYPGRTKLNVHIKKTHPGQQLVGGDDGGSPLKAYPSTANGQTVSGASAGVGSGGVFDADAFTKKIKYQEKRFKCNQCGKGYVDRARLKLHIEHRHTKHDDPLFDVEPNTDIVVRSSRSPEGYEVFKVRLSIYLL